MPKIKPTILQIKGKKGDRVYVDSKTYGYHERAAPAPGRKKHEPAFEAQHSRTGLLNRLAGELNRIIKIYAGSLQGKGFYVSVQKQFRSEPRDHIYCLLQTLKGLAVKPQYGLARFGPVPLIGATIKNKKINVRLDVTSHPDTKHTGADCYYYELVFLCRTRGKDGYIHSSQLSEWLFIKERPAVFEFSFDAPAKPAQWLACVKLVLGCREKELNRFEGEGMGIVEVGSFLKEDKLIEKPVKAKVVKKTAVKEVVRVKKVGYK